MKALKILVHDLRSGGESAALGGQADDLDLESDDGVNHNDFHPHTLTDFSACRMKNGLKRRS